MHQFISMASEKASKFLADNSSTILTAGGVVGTGMTAVLTAKATFKAAELIQETNVERFGEERDFLTTTEKVKLVWPYYIPPFVVATATMGSIVAANMVSAKRAAALAAAYGISERNLREYKEKAAEKLGITKDQKIHDEIAQERVNDNPPTKEVLILAGGDVLCFDMHTGRYFRSTMENLKQAENTVNQELYNHQYASLSYFYDEIGIPPTSFSDEVGWNMAQTGPLELRFSTVLSPDNQPCIAVDFTNPPKTEYTQLY